MSFDQDFFSMFEFTNARTNQRIKSVDDLSSSDEKKDYEDMVRMMQDAQVTPTKVEDVLKKNRDLLIDKLSEIMYAEESKENWAKCKFLVARLINCRAFLTIFDEPEIAKRKIEAYAKKRVL